MTFENMTRGGKKVRKKDKDTRRRPETSQVDTGKDEIADTLDVPKPAQQVPEEMVDKLSKYIRNDEMQEIYKIFEDQKICIDKDLSEVHPLLGGVILGKFDLVKRFLTDVNLLSRPGPGRLTPLMWAVKNKSLEMVDLLLIRGADVTVTDGDGNNAILLAPQSNGWRQESFLDLWNAVKDIAGFDVNHANVAGITILHYAAKKDWDILIESLMEKKVQVNCVTKKGVTPLMLAGSENYCHVVKLLLRSGASVALEDERGCTVLCYAIAYMIQKGKQTPTIRTLVNAFNDELITMEDYLQRRLDLLVSPPMSVARFTETVANIMTTVVNFFVRHMRFGLETLLELKVFHRLVEATREHTDDAQCCHALVGVMFELVRFCSCCFGSKEDSPRSEEIVAKAFFEAGAADACLEILKKHGDVDELMCAALLPLFSVCSVACEATTQWLQGHYQELKPFYKRFMQFYLVSCNFCNTDESHIRLVKQKVKAFKKVMNSILEQKSNLLVKDKCNKKPELILPEDDVSVPEVKSEVQPTTIEDIQDRPEDEQLPVLGTCSKKVRRKAAKALKMKLAKKRAQEMVERNLKTVDSLKPDIFLTTTNGIELSPKYSTGTTDTDKIVDQLYIETTNEIKSTEQNVESTPGDWVTLWDHTFGDTSSPNCSDETPYIDRSLELLNAFENTQFNKNNDEDVEMFKNNEIIDLKSENVASNPSDALASHQNVLNSNDNLNIKEGNHIQSDASDARYLPGQTTRDDRCNITDKTDLFAKDFYSTPNKQINDASYFDNLFKDIITKYLKMWQLERDNSYPGHRVNYCDVRHMKIKQDTNLLKLEKILPGLEQEYIQRLETRWKSLTSKLQRVGRDKFEKISARLFALLKYFTQELESKLQCMDFEAKTRKRPWTTEGTGCASDYYAGSLESPILGGYSNATQSTNPPNNFGNTCNIYHLCNANDRAVNDKTGGCKNALLENTNNSLVLETSFSAVVKRSKVSLPKDAENKQPPHGELSQRPPNVAKRPQPDMTRNDEATGGSARAVVAAEKLTCVPPPPGFPAQPTARREVNLATTARLLPSSERCMQRLPPVSPSSSRWDNLVSSIQEIETANRQVGTSESYTVGIESSKSRFAIQSSGSFGTFELGVDMNGFPIVVKRIPFQNEQLLDAMKHMLNSLTKLRHQHIAHYTTYSQQNNVLFFAIPLYECNLGEYITLMKDRNTCNKARGVELMRQMVSGLHYLHTNVDPVIHGNLKPSNVLISIKGTVKLADFGFNQILYTMVWPQMTSLVWWARESLSTFQSTSLADWTIKSDICVAGMLLHFIDTEGAHPFGNDPNQIMQNIVLHQPLLRTRCPELQDLVTAMIRRNPAARPCIVDVSKHTFFWDDAKKWRLLLACGGIISDCRHLPLSYVEDLHNYIDKKLALTDVYRNWTYAVSGRFPQTMSPQERSTSTVSSLVRFIRLCVEQDREPSRFSFPLRTFFLTTFPTLPMTLYKLVENTEWMEHYALDKFKP